MAIPKGTEGHTPMMQRGLLRVKLRRFSTNVSQCVSHVGNIGAINAFLLKRIVID
jgi:hypothetical protein